jgi:hypothetical protein
MQSRRGEGAFILTRFLRVGNKCGVKESKSTFQKYRDLVIVGNLLSRIRKALVLWWFLEGIPVCQLRLEASKVRRPGPEVLS